MRSFAPDHEESILTFQTGDVVLVDQIKTLDPVAPKTVNACFLIYQKHLPADIARKHDVVNDRTEFPMPYQFAECRFIREVPVLWIWHQVHDADLIIHPSHPSLRAT